MKSRLFICGGAPVPAGDEASFKGSEIVALATQGEKRNVNLKVEDVATVFKEDLSKRLTDFLEIASYVYAGDASTRREGAWTDDYTTESWGRNFKFVIPVRDVDFWSKPKTKAALIDVLNNLSDDSYEFEFLPLKKEPPKQSYLQFGKDKKWPFLGVDRVLMFSGGLDSLAGAIESSEQGKSLVLVSHRPVTTLDSRQKKLYAELCKRLSTPTIRIPVWVNKEKKLGREHTQRTRSFLFAALGTAVAESLKAEGVRFFENGIVSVNLPVADEVLRARASRTTNPYTLILLGRLCSLIVGRKFIIDNPYIFKTKRDVVAIFSKAEYSGLIQLTCSCAHTGFFHSKTQWHCGACSQCIDRRFAILAAGLENHDPAYDYYSDVFTGPRKEGPEQNMAVDFVRHALEIQAMSENEIVRTFNTHLSRASRDQPRQREFAEQLVRIHKRHGEIARDVLRKQLEVNSGRIVDSDLPESSLIALVTGQKHKESSWARYCDKIARILSAGVPTICKGQKPKNETDLQLICDGLLQSRDEELVREFPFMQWSSNLTKPDWSIEPLLLWVEMKYVRKRADIRPITEAIAADITKYGDSNRRVFFVVYDPGHHVPNDDEFSEQILKRPTMRVHFIR
jgi:7-cyano-7-deazaguanine synthase in queuosine biosynthesis